jgi:hypothetical protein
MRALLATSSCAALVAIGCSRSTALGGQTTGEQQQEAFTQACVSVSAKHPGTMTVMASAIGGNPSECAVAPGACFCNWTFFTTQGARKIVVASEYADGSAAVTDVTNMLVAQTKAAVDVPDDQVQQGFMSGRYLFPASHQRVPVRTSDGQIGTLEALDLQEAIKKNGCAVVAHSVLRRAELEKQYEKLSLADRLSRCMSSSGKTLSVQLGDEEPVLY